ncbi:MAG TPA: ABC transporter permease [Limnochordia bacterium]|nr:ABC transporter permease [Limnochordia bacterium]
MPEASHQPLTPGAASSAAAAHGPWEFKRDDRRAFLKATGAVMRAQFRAATFFLPSWLIGLLGTVSSAAIFFLMGRYVDAGAAPWMQAYGGDYGAYILLGVGFNGLLNAGLNGYYQAYSEGYWSNAFEMYATTPRGVGAYMLGAPVVRYGMALLDAALWLLLAAALFRVPLAWSHLGAATLLLLLGLIATTGLGLTAASTFTLLNAKQWSNPISWLVEFLAGLFAGLYFPPEILPAGLRTVAVALPHTYVFDAARRVLLGGAGLTDPAVVRDAGALAILALIWLPIGGYLFRRSLLKAARDGSLSRWN